MDKIKHKILVMSGKGGVGKTTVAVNLAYAFSEKGFKVGLLDVDIHGPNIPKMLNLEDKKLIVKDKRMIPVQYNDRIKVISFGFLLEKSDAVIWRGPMKHNLIKQFLQEVEWGDLDFLLIDFPPGTGDEAISISQLLKDITGSIIVSTPQEVALLDAVKAIDFSEKTEIPVLGLIENMSGEVFGKGRVEDTAKEKGIEFLGRIKLNPEIRKSGDIGIPFISSNPEYFDHIADRTLKKVGEK